MTKFKVRYWETVSTLYEVIVDKPEVTTKDEAEEYVTDFIDYNPVEIISEEIQDFYINTVEEVKDD